MMRAAVVQRLVPFLFAVLASMPALADFSFEDVKESVVRVITVVERDGKFLAAGHGTGFVINDRGNVVTNHHVIKTPDLPRGVTLKGFFVPDGSFDNMRQANVIWSSAALDLAVLEVADLRRPSVELSDREPDSGVDVWPVGFPGVAENFAGERAELLVPTVSKGVVGKMLTGGDPKRPETIRRLVQHGAALNPGNSGGPLYNACNQVVGINTFGVATVLPVKKADDGSFVAAGAPSAGVFFSSHVSVLIKELVANGIPYSSVSGACLLTSDGKTPLGIYILVAVVTIFAGASLILTLRKPRERVVRVVETYSQMLRRKAKEEPPRAAPPQQQEWVARPEPRTTAPKKKVAWMLSGFDGDGNTLRYVVEEGNLGKTGEGVTIGRNSELCDFVVEDTSVSRRHARLLAEPGVLTVEDLNSSNGTSAAGRALAPYQPVELRAGDTLVLGDVKLTVSTA